MKKQLLFIISALVCGLMVTNCGGGSKNEYLGALPSIYASYYTEKDAYEKKMEEKAKELFLSGKFDKVVGLQEEKKSTLKEMEEQFEKDVRIESDNLIDREIPISYSEALKKSDELFYSITPIKLKKNERGDLATPIKIIANKDIVFPSGSQYVHYRYVAADGSTLSCASVYVIGQSARERSFSANDVLREVDYDLSFMERNADSWVNFAGIEFCTYEEFSEASKLL